MPEISNEFWEAQLENKKKKHIISYSVGDYCWKFLKN